MINDKKEYATVFEDDGADYRFISKMMSDVGWKMNHTSARNHVLRIMNKFAKAYVKKLGLHLNDENIAKISRDARFQSAISDILHIIYYDKGI